VTLASTLVRAGIPIAVLAAAAAFAAPASAQTEVAVKVFQDFAADGIIDPCKHSSEDLRAVQKNIPPDIEQYAPDYPAAVAGALEARARGDCSGSKPEAALPPVEVTPAAPAPVATPVPTAIPTQRVIPEPPQPETAAQASVSAVAASTRPDAALERVATARAANDAPAPVLLLAILAGLLAAGALLFLVMRRFGWGDERLAPARHAMSEASWRAGGVWQDFRDWLELGR